MIWFEKFLGQQSSKENKDSSQVKNSTGTHRRSSGAIPSVDGPADAEVENFFKDLENAGVDTNPRIISIKGERTSDPNKRKRGAGGQHSW